jgi:DNA-binding HxlR family transcriptional regulator|nr:helix-turn-helix domain-containing protein [Streptomyces sp. MSC1_001]
MVPMALGKDYAHQQCTIARALEVIGERWTLLLVRDAFYGVRRYNDFLAHLGAPRAVLAARLQALVEADVLERRRYQESPPRDEYVLTARGLALWPVLLSLGAWGRTEDPAAAPVRHFHHADCGTEISSYGTCPVCRVPVPPADVEMRPGAGLDPDPGDPVGRALLEPRRLLEPLRLPSRDGNS